MLPRITRPVRRPFTCHPRSAHLTLTPHALPLVPSLRLRLNSTSTSTTLAPPPPPERTTASFYISNVFPIQIGRLDPRPTLAAFLREETILEELHDITQMVSAHEFRVESWEISRKDGGVFMHFSYVAPTDPDVSSRGTPRAEAKEHEQVEKEVITREVVARAGVEVPSAAWTYNLPGRLFIPHLEEAARANGGWPSWLGEWWATKKFDANREVPGHRLYSAGEEEGEEEGVLVRGSKGGVLGLQAAAGGGRVWVVKGKQWTEDMNRFPSNRLRVEFDGPDVSQEMIYTLFRPYGRVADITPLPPYPPAHYVSPPSLTPASLQQPSPSTLLHPAQLHGYSTATNTADFTLRVTGAPSASPIPTSRLRLYYDRPIKAHAVRDWAAAHPRIVLPVLAFLFGTLSYTFFDPMRAFFVRSQLEGVWDIEKYSAIKYLREKFVLPTSLGFFTSSLADPSSSNDIVGKNAWKDRVEAEKGVEQWLGEYPSTFITITGPPGSGKSSLVKRVLNQQDKPAMVIDCDEIAKAKSDSSLVSALAAQTGYYPVFSFMSSISGLIDLAAMGLIGQKAGLSTPIDQQLRQMLEIVGGALKDVSVHAQQSHQDQIKCAEDEVAMEAERARKRLLIARGGWHDGRLDCVAGNGLSELGVGDEPFFENDMDEIKVPLVNSTDQIAGDEVPASSAALADTDLSSEKMLAAAQSAAAVSVEEDSEGEFIKSLPIVVLKNFAQKTAKGDLWNVLAEWGASLVENRVAHVIVVTEGPTATKALTKALPSKPLNSVGLADADESNALEYVREKLRSSSHHAEAAEGGEASSSTGKVLAPATLSVEESQQISKLGGRMVDLETLVYKVRTGSSIKDAVNDIVLRNVVELRKAVFGDDSEDAKGLHWTRAQAWKVVSELAKKGEVSYPKLLQEFPFKGAEQSLKALEEHELVSVTYIDGRASMLKPGKPVFRYAFESMINDPVFRASCQIEYNAAVIAKAESDIKAYENELTTLKSIATEGGSEALGVSGGWLGIGGHSAIRDRGKWLLDKMGKLVEKTGNLEKENEEMVKVLSTAR